MFSPTYSFPDKTPAGVAAMVFGAQAKGLHKIAAAIVANYPTAAPVDAGNEFIRIIHDRTCGSNTLF